jgi:hypothetical protein
MTSLAYYAAPFEGEPDSNKDSHMNKKRRNRTLKRSSTVKNHVQSMINEIHKSPDRDESSEDLSDFDMIQNNNIPPPSSRPPAEQPSYSSIDQPDALIDKPVSLESFDNLQNNYAQQYYNQYIPTTDKMNETQPTEQRNLLEKLDHIILLLEESKDEKTGHVAEELVLYSFLGVFIIFIIDSFARAGKYVR